MRHNPLRQAAPTATPSAAAPAPAPVTPTHTPTLPLASGFHVAVLLAQNVNFTWYLQHAGMPLRPSPTAAVAAVAPCIVGEAYSVRWVNTTTGGTVTSSLRVHAGAGAGAGTGAGTGGAASASGQQRLGVGGGAITCPPGAQLRVPIPVFTQDVAALVQLLA